MVLRNINAKSSGEERNLANKFTPILFNLALTLMRKNTPKGYKNGVEYTLMGVNAYSFDEAVFYE